MNFKMSSCTFSKYVLRNNNFKTLSFPRSFSSDSNLEKNSHSNPFLEKYASKIAEVKKKSPEDFNKSLEHNLQPTGISNLHSKSSYCSRHDDKKQMKISHFQKLKDLNQIMKVDALRDKSATEIETIWKEYHRVKDGVYAVLPANSFVKMYSNMKENPVFLFPLPRAQGYEFIMCQFLDQSCYFTSLLNYQAFKENAPICLTVTYFTEFQKEKDIILMRGEYDSSLKAHEAQCLTNQLQLFYGGQDEEKNALLRKFNKQPETFKHIDLISNFELSFGN